MEEKSKDRKRCSFCGRLENEVSLLITGLNGYICNNCVFQAYEIAQEAMGGAIKGNVKELNLKELPKPKEIKAFLDQYVIGQEDAKRYLSVSVYNHFINFYSCYWFVISDYCKKMARMMWRLRSLTLLWLEALVRVKHYWHVLLLRY